MSRASEVREARQALQRRRTALRERLAASGEDRSLRLELAEVEEDLAALGRRLRELEPRHKVSYRATWAGKEGQAWDRLQYQTWAELEGAEEPEGPTEREQMLQALREAREAATPTQRAYLAAVEEGARPAAVARGAGRDKSTLSRTLARGRANITREARRRYQLKRAAQVGEDGVPVLDLRDRETLEAVLSMLTEKQRLYLTLYYGEWMSLGEIGSLLGVDRSGVLRTIRRGLERLDSLAEGSLRLTGLDSLEELLMERYQDLRPEDLAPRPGLRAPPPRTGGSYTPPYVPEEGERRALEEGRALFDGGGGGKLLPWLEELRQRAEAALGGALPTRERQGFFRRLLIALCRLVVQEAKKPPEKAAGIDKTRRLW